MTLPGGLHSSEEVRWFKEIFDQLYDNIRSFIYYKTGDMTIAEDYAQETFLKIWDIRHKIKNDTLKPLIYTIAGNLVKNHFKHRQVVLKFETENQATDNFSEDADSEIRQTQLLGAIEKAISEMPEKIRVTFLMNRIENLTYNEIATRLGLSIKAVEKRMSEALSFLRKRIDHRL